MRGNIETRLRKLIEGDEHGLVVAKAALDRLLGFGRAIRTRSRGVRAHLDHCRWMVLPMREFPWAPAQGAMAIEIRERRAPILSRLLDADPVRVDAAAVNYERQVLDDHGGGCHQALGAAVIEKPYGRVVSIRRRANRRRHVAAGRRPPSFRAPATMRYGRGRTKASRPMRHAMDVEQPSGDGVSGVACRCVAGDMVADGRRDRLGGRHADLAASGRARRLGQWLRGRPGR